MPPAPSPTSTTSAPPGSAWLRMAHQRLDAAVFAAYRWDPTLTDDDLLARLLARLLASLAPAPANREED